MLNRAQLARAAADEQLGIFVTPPISVTVQCVINLAVQYFLGFLSNWTVVSVKS